MKKQILNIEDLTYSKEMIKAKEPVFILIILMIVLFLVLAAFIWSYFFKIDQVVKATGIVRSYGESTVRNIKEGYIKRVNLESGKKVKKDELLYSLDTRSLKTDEKMLKKRIQRLNNNIRYLEILKKCMNRQKNYFQDHITIPRDIKKDELDFYSNRYINYRQQYEKLEIEMEKAENEYLNKKDIVNIVSPREVDVLKTNLRTAKLNISEFEIDSIINIDNEIFNIEDEIFQLEQELNNVLKGIKLSRIKAPIPGNIQLKELIKKDDYLPAGIEVLKIIPDNNSEYKMKIKVENKDISQIHKGQLVKYRLYPFPYKEFGVVTGNILQINEDTTDDSTTYSIMATIDQNKFYDRNGKEYELKSGMAGEVKIISGEKTIFNYIMEKLDLRW